MNLLEKLKHNKNKLATMPLIIAGLGATACSAEAEPAQQPESFETSVQQSAQVPYDPATDELLVDTIRIKPANSELNSASEAVEANARVDTYLETNPDETASIDISSNTVPAADSYVVVERDVDGDGDSDAIVVPRS